MSDKKINAIFQAADTNHTEYQINVSQDMTGFQLKQYIYQHVAQTLAALQMTLKYAGIKIQNQKKLSQYKMVQNQIRIIQYKVSIQQIPGLILSYELDQITGQNINCRMPCGHVVSQAMITSFIRHKINSKSFKILCPSQKPNGDQCQGQWDFALCRKIGVFTKEEVQQFQKGLANNWVHQNTFQCPSCSERLFKGDIKGNRVRCPKCNYGDFCSFCLKKWNNTGNDLCGNEGCKVADHQLFNCLWTKPFNLLHPDKTYKQILTPTIRACTKCFCIMQHTSGCKHVTCKNCKNSYCWVCLSSPDKNGSWSCGSSGTYCGKIQPAQKIGN